MKMDNNKCKTVLHIVEAPGGVERYLRMLLSAMREYSGFNHVLVCSTKYNQNDFLELVSSVEIVDSMCHEISLGQDLRTVRAVRKLIKKYKPDIVYCHSTKAGAIGRLANIGKRNKLIYNAHGWAFNMVGIGRKKTFVYRCVERILAPLANVIVCISDYEMESALRNKICKAKKLKVINNGIDFADYSNSSPLSRDQLNIPKNAFVVGMIGRISAQKAPDTFIRMAAEIKKNLSNAFFIIVGDDIDNGQYRIEIEALIKEYNLDDSILITGWVNDPKDYVGVFNVACLLSRWEGFGLVLPEYMYAEKPIVATRVDAIPFVVGDAGLLVEVDDFRNAANSVIRLFEDSNLVNELVSKGKDRVKLFDINCTAKQSADLFNSL